MPSSCFITSQGNGRFSASAWMGFFINMLDKNLPWNQTILPAVQWSVFYVAWSNKNTLRVRCELNSRSASELSAERFHRQGSKSPPLDKLFPGVFSPPKPQRQSHSLPRSYLFIIVMDSHGRIINYHYPCHGKAIRCTADCFSMALSLEKNMKSSARIKSSPMTFFPPLPLCILFYWQSLWGAV